MNEEKEKTVLAETGRFAIDLAKLIFGGIILAGIMKYENGNSALLYSISSVAVLISFISGIILLAISQKEDK